MQQYSLIACNMLGTGTESGGVVIVGGHERMARQYWDTGREYCGEATVLTQVGDGLRAL